MSLADSADENDKRDPRPRIPDCEISIVSSAADKSIANLIADNFVKMGATKDEEEEEESARRATTAP